MNLIEIDNNKSLHIYETNVDVLISRDSPWDACD